MHLGHPVVLVNDGACGAVEGIAIHRPAQNRTGLPLQTCPTMHHTPIVHDQELPGLQFDSTLEFLTMHELVELVVGCIPLRELVESESRGGPVDLVILNPDEISIFVR